ncbi:uncharacterized protein LOC142823523 isoform X8 [Pelodiscus sinensis]|uniref:uncharacterized protein LOC142823523 isoform X8 n=1 Tax=Pelodiscus sinensis TaxID=13735 RepID=UPI003F6B8B92
MARGVVGSPSLERLRGRLPRDAGPRGLHHGGRHPHGGEVPVRLRRAGLHQLRHPDGDVGGSRGGGRAPEAALGHGRALEPFRPVVPAERVSGDPAEPGAGGEGDPGAAGAPRGLGVPQRRPPRLQRLLRSTTRGPWLMLCVPPPVPPEVSVSRRDAPHGPVTLSCRASGFYPRPIHLFWVRDGGDVLAETSSSGILPLADGTYHTQSSLEIGPRPDGPRYACRVEHSSLPAPVLVWAPEKGPLPPGVLAAIVLAVLGLAGAAGAGVWLWRRKSAGHWEPGYAPAARKTGEDSASSSASGTEPRSAGSRS